MPKKPGTLQEQLEDQRRTVDFDTYDLAVQQLVTMVNDGDIQVAPRYQRKFRWDEERSSQLIESLLLGVPVPSLFMATNPDSTWELVDGVQRVSSIVCFMGSDELREAMHVEGPLKLTGLQKLDAFNGLTYEQLPKSIQLHLRNRPIKVVTLSDKSDLVIRFDLFERLNTGGVSLTDQEIRGCIYRGKFADFLEELSEDEDLEKFLRLSKKQEKDGTREECVLRFFAFYYRYKKFVHSVKGFLNDYMADAMKNFDYEESTEVFNETFATLAEAVPDGLRRPHRRGNTSLILFEAVSVGAALAFKESGTLDCENMNDWLGNEELTKNTTGATNNQKAVRARIEFCRDRFLGN